MVRLITANLDFATGPRRDRGYLRRLAGLSRRSPRRWLKRRLAKGHDLEPRILFLQEAKTGRVRLLLSRLFRGLQGRGEARSGTALMAYGIKLHNRRLWSTGDSPDTLERFATEGVVRVDGQGVLLVDVHVFPLRAGSEAQRQQLLRVKARLQAAEDNGQPWIVGGDFNMPPAAAAGILGGRAYGNHVDGFVVHPDVIVGENRPIWHGRRAGVTDHAAYSMDVVGVR